MRRQDFRVMSDTSPALKSAVFSRAEETANAITHGCGLLLSLVGAVYLIPRAAASGGIGWIVACGVYALSLAAVYTASTLSHALIESPRLALYRRLDQALIYILIIATYTPLSVAYLRGAWWSTFLGLLWTIALLGFVFKLVSGHRVEIVALATYVALGWLPVLSAPTMMQVAPPPTLWWILIGGLCYTFGTVFLFCDKRVRYFHAVWHIFVLAGSSFHFFAILRIAETVN